MKYILTLALAFVLWGCNDDYLEKQPMEKLTEETAFVSAANFKTYAWSLYAIFSETKNEKNVPKTSMKDNMLRMIEDTPNGYFKSDRWAGYLNNNGLNSHNQFAWREASRPASGGGWDFDYVRKVNLMLSKIDGSEMTEKEKTHWRAVGYFFRAFRYTEFVSRFANVPWVENVLGENDEMVYGAANPRAEVVDSIMSQLLWAEQNIGSSKWPDGNSTVDINCVRMIISRFGLFESTWRKYHSGHPNTQVDEGAAKFKATDLLAQSIRASEELIKSFPTIHDNFDEVTNSKDLSTIPGIILYKEYLRNTLPCTWTYTERATNNTNEMTKQMVEMYLCQDGKPISTSTVYDGDKTPYDEFRNRDRRLLFTVCPPYEVDAKGTKWNKAKRTWDIVYTSDPKHREYIDYMRTISREGFKFLPISNWANNLAPVMPHFADNSFIGPVNSRTGYYLYKNHSEWDETDTPNNTESDKPIFRVEEAMLNLAEAKFEQGLFDQSVADLTINPLRRRAGVAEMMVGEISGQFDPKRDPSVDPVLWEIRRERTVELMCEGFGFYDIRRWRVAPWFLSCKVYGCWIDKKMTQQGKPISKTLVDQIENHEDAGYILRADPVGNGYGWDDTYYLFALPLNQLALNPKLVQNPGWEKY